LLLASKFYEEVLTLTMNVQPNIQKTQKPVLRPAAQPVHFGLEPTGTFTKMADAGFKSLTANRTKQMLIEDLIGFGVMRTGVDLWRGKAYGNDQMNWPAGLERMGRETASIATDNILAGLVAAGMGKVIFDKVSSSNKVAAFNNKFVEYPTLEAFQVAAKNLKVGEGQEAFLSNLSKQYFLEEHRTKGTELFNTVWKMSAKAREASKDKNQKLITDGQEALSCDIEAETVKFLEKHKGPKSAGEIQNGFSYVKKMDEAGKITEGFNLRALLEDVRGFSQHMEGVMEKPAGKSWKTLAEESIARTLKAKAVTIPVGLGVATAATFAVPFVISAASRKFMGIDYYPGEIGLRKEDPKDQPSNPQAPQKSFWEKHAPYLTESIKKGNYWPLFWTLAPLPLAAGLLNTTRLSKLGLPVLVKSRQEWKHLFDYQKGAPWTAQQQMSSLFAVLISSRLLNSRSDNEYRERVLDSFVGWGAWIMGTPLLNKVAGNLSDKISGTKLVKADGSLRSRAEIEALLTLEKTGKNIAQKTLNRHILMNVGTTLTTMGILGVAIPWMGVKMTQNNEKRKQQLRDAQKPAAQPAQPTGSYGVKPWAASTQPSPFNSLPANATRPAFAPMQAGLNSPATIWQMPQRVVGGQAQ